jgi:prepilin-type N-terminal cleavage/methylation domain-containing protein/prepilin-type processing-associated H-X9-DG protein
MKHESDYPRHRKSMYGFTLIELLVVIAIIALLMAIIIPSLRAAKEIAAAVVCMSNNRQLGVAYYTYADENDGKLADASPYVENCFSGEPRNETGAWHNTCLEDKIRGFEAGVIWPYLESPDVYHCPVDKRWRKPPTDPAPSHPLDINTIGGYRSYSLGAVLSAAGYGETGTGENEYVIIKYSDFSNPGSKITFLEEQAGDGFNENYWDVYLNSDLWWDPFAIVHNGSSTFAYADGHAERHKWTDKNMIAYAAEGKKSPPVDTTSDDYNWFKRVYIPGRTK